MAIVRNDELHYDNLVAMRASGSLYQTYVSLYKNDITPGPDDVYSDYDLAEATGLTSQALTWSSVIDDADGGYQVIANRVEFRRSNNTDPSETFRGYIVHKAATSGSAEMRFQEEFDSPHSLENTLQAINLLIRFGEGLSSEVSATVDN